MDFAGGSKLLSIFGNHRRTVSWPRLAVENSIILKILLLIRGGSLLD
jgi:hypothetical protein